MEGRVVEWRGASLSGGGMFCREEGLVVKWRGHVSSRVGTCRRVASGGGMFRREEYTSSVSSRGGAQLSFL